MELYDVLRTTFAAREFTADPLPDEVLAKILDQARFAPSGGNRQGWRVIVVRDHATKDALAALSAPAAKRFTAQVQAGEPPTDDRLARVEIVSQAKRLTNARAVSATSRQPLSMVSEWNQRLLHRRTGVNAKT